MIYLIVGRTGSGKDYLANKLCDTFKLVQLKSYTTRPKRTENEDTHIFINSEESKLYTDRVAETIINGYEYFATRQQVNKSDIYLIDPNGIKVLLSNMPETQFSIIYVTTLDYIRKQSAINRVGFTTTNIDIINSRNESEDEQFSLFEKSYLNGLQLDTDTKLIYKDNPITDYSNVERLFLYSNGYNAEYCSNWCNLFYNAIIKIVFK